MKASGMVSLVVACVTLLMAIACCFGVQRAFALDGSLASAQTDADGSVGSRAALLPGSDSGVRAEAALLPGSNGDAGPVRRFRQACTPCRWRL